VYADEFSLKTARVGNGTYVVAVSGELDLHSVGQLRAELEQAMDRGAEHVVVDLACVTFMDSTALGAIVLAERSLRRSNGSLVVVSDDPRVARLFSITGLDRLIRLWPSLNAAVDDLAHAALR
jgi:anti-sigma B factor antagonist